MFIFKTSGIEGSYSTSSNPLFVSNSWTIYPARHRTTKKRASVWQFNKKDYEARLLRDGAISHSNRDLVLGDIYDNLKRYVSNLAKLRHPNFLTVIEPLEDHKNRLLFVTEYVVNDLATVDKTDLDEIIITKGLLQVATGLKFLHQSVSTVHLNIAPDSILITENFDWKISGLQFMQVLENNAVAERFTDPLDSRMPDFLSIDFKFSSPNLLLRHNADYIDDLFSIACLIFYLFNEGRPMIECSNSSLLEYERSFNRLNHNLQSVESTGNTDHPFFSKIPPNYRQIFFNLIRQSQESTTDVIELQKPLTIDDFINSAIFNNELIKILNIIDEFQALQNTERIDFLSGLRNQINNFPKALLINKFIPVLTDAVSPYFKSTKKLQNDDEQIISLSIENLLLLSKTLSQLTFTDRVFPVLTQSLESLDLDTIKSLLIAHLETIRTKLGVSGSDEATRSKHYQNFQSFLSQLFEKSISHSSSALPSSIKLQEALLGNLKTFLDYQSYSVITNKLLPLICNLFSTTTSLRVKVLTIKAFILMINGMADKSLDNYVIVERLLPLVRKTQASNLKNADLLSTMVSLYDNLFTKLRGTTGKLSVGNEEVSVDDLILESVFFEVWKLTKFVTRRSDMDAIFQLLQRMEAYLKNETEKRQREEPETESQRTLSPSPMGDDMFSSEFSGVQPAKPSRLEKNGGSELKGLGSMQRTFQRSSPAIQRAASPRSVLQVSRTSSSLQDSFQRSSPSLQQTETGFRNSSPSLQQASFTKASPSFTTSSFMQPMKATKSSGASTLPTSARVSPSPINWSKEKPTTTANGWTKYPDTTNSLFEPIKPTKKLNQGTYH
ncbi:DEKNAAC105388 [Brettanomyces naardenensis]|uniref:DEKNAAC105388 n=1 Tax=Brettanomyces naardenensis TaxID=13370 RepID=A0A448YTC8_BRENA|nr:DEKNAAC105388 [Brettanomyces naardenensis]